MNDEENKNSDQTSQSKRIKKFNVDENLGEEDIAKDLNEKSQEKISETKKQKPNFPSNSNNSVKKEGEVINLAGALNEESPEKAIKRETENKGVQKEGVGKQIDSEKSKKEGNNNNLAPSNKESKTKKVDIEEKLQIKDSKNLKKDKNRPKPSKNTSTGIEGGSFIPDKKGVAPKTEPSSNKIDEENVKDERKKKEQVKPGEPKFSEESLDVKKLQKDKKIEQSQEKPEAGKKEKLKDSKETAPKNNTSDARSSIRTFESDAAEILSGQGQSLSKIALAEQRKKEGKGGGKSGVSKKKRSILPIVVAILLLILGGGALYFAFFTESNEEERVVLPESIIFTDSDVEIDASSLSGKDLADELNEERTNYNGSLGSVLNTYLVVNSGPEKRVLTSQEFLNRLNIRSEPSLIRNLSEEMMFGVHAFDGNQGFLIFKVDNFDVVFARMLDWERNIFADLEDIFYENVESELNFREDNPLGSIGQFRDRVFKNRDTRVFEDNLGETVLVYSFPNRETLVITSDMGTLNEIFSRMTATRFDN